MFSEALLFFGTLAFLFSLFSTTWNRDKLLTSSCTISRQLAGRLLSRRWSRPSLYWSLTSNETFAR